MQLYIMTYVDLDIFSGGGGNIRHGADWMLIVLAFGDDWHCCPI